MSDVPDIRAILRTWPYDPENSARVSKLDDGRLVIQVRLPFGIEQYERDGRPDGRHPHGAKSVLEYYQQRLRRAEEQGQGDSFRLSHVACEELFEEGVIYYYRYLRLFELEDWERTVRDTARNIRLFDFVHRHAGNEQDSLHLEQWRPYILRIHAVARAMIELGRENYGQAVRMIERAMTAIEALPDLRVPTFEYERERSLEALQATADRIRKTRPLDEIEKLERELGRAVRHEKFERAAVLRDRIQELRADR